MRKRIITAAILFALTAGITGYAALDYSGILTKPFEISGARLGIALDTGNSGYMDIYSKIQSESENNEEAYMTFYSYLYALNKNKASENQSEYLNSLILSGCKTKLVTEIFDFISETKYDVSLVQEIYNRASETDFVGSYWIEEAFNDVTENTHGVLDTHEIENYMEKGITIEDVTAANKLSRQGVYTINEILDKCVAGEDFGSVAEKVYMQSSAIKTGTAKRLKKKAAPEDIIRAAELSAITGNTIDTFLINGELTETAAAEIEAELGEKTLRQLEAIGIADPDKSNKEINYELIGLALENGITGEEADMYLSEGYEDIDILNASEYVKALGCTMEKGFRELNNEGLLVSGYKEAEFTNPEVGEK